MFEQLESYLSEREYRNAAAILSFLGRMFRPRPQSTEDHYSNAQVRVIGLENMIHIFIVVDRHQDWWQIPADLQPFQAQPDGTVLMEKTIDLKPHFDPEYKRFIRYHYIHIQDAAQAVELVA